MSNVTVAVSQPGEIARPLTEICKWLPISEAKLRPAGTDGRDPVNTHRPRLLSVRE